MKSFLGSGQTGMKITERRESQEQKRNILLFRGQIPPNPGPGNFSVITVEFQ